jgi:hypothetical protein
MKQILSLLLLCSLPITALANGPARRVGTALIKLIRYSEYIGRNGRFYEPECIASHTLPLHENSDNKHTIKLSTVKTEDTATVHITHAFLTEARVAIKFDQQDPLTLTPTATETTITYLKPLDLEGGCVQEKVPGGVRHDYEKVEVRLTKVLLSSEQTSDTNNPEDVESKK